ncbi:UDPglucose--hexose-1-phosphate uridylyltransferase [Hypnocyclicus thermotrophus]|uniref:Galactose-1-phosphate uridylyltransferase n=1 Tax=Hypnocyclicus thermotrophus TaxID=1627895 RepID=A0AA46DXE5_9FUSO|nr:galactose-1-phosphate uridylyltransferase [Hypnocyclicus thermotrophus]TDT68007.1 UDPglucose--hexose-1-phosphate uridylyltransferase [Hypnocyclicus thermotrophus]
MSELRKDPVSKRWVIFSPERAYRPNDYKVKKEKKEKEEDKYCPFCSGNEKKSGDEILAYPKTANREPNSPNWWIRVLENKYPALTPQQNLEKKGVGIYDRMNGLGRHEIIVETEDHKRCISDLTNIEVEKIIWAYRDRYIDISQEKEIKHILIFKNYGERAGASLEHSHSQLIATPVVPKRVETEIKGAKDYYKFRDRCVYCDILSQEQLDKERIIEENEEFVAFNFFAGKVPYETWIVPKKHSAFFSTITKKQIGSLAKILKNVITRIKRALGDVDYNMVVHTSPINIHENTEDVFHWHLEIMPKLTRIAGFEWGTGFYINPVLPEDAAKTLREIKLDE